MVKSRIFRKIAMFFTLLESLAYRISFVAKGLQRCTTAAPLDALNLPAL